MAADTVGADDHGSLSLWQESEGGLILQHHDPLFLQVLDNLLIVYDGAKCVDRAFGLPCLQGVYLLVHLVHCPFHAKAEACAFCHHYLAPRPFPAHAPTSRPRSQAMRIMASATCSMVIPELSNRTASSACLSGECSRFISR